MPARSRARLTQSPHGTHLCHLRLFTGRVCGRHRRRWRPGAGAGPVCGFSDHPPGHAVWRQQGRLDLRHRRGHRAIRQAGRAALGRPAARRPDGLRRLNGRGLAGHRDIAAVFAQAAAAGSARRVALHPGQKRAGPPPCAALYRPRRNAGGLRHRSGDRLLRRLLRPGHRQFSGVPVCALAGL